MKSVKSNLNYKTPFNLIMSNILAPQKKINLMTDNWFINALFQLQLLDLIHCVTIFGPSLWPAL